MRPGTLIRLLLLPLLVATSPAAAQGARLTRPDTLSGRPAPGASAPDRGAVRERRELDAFRDRERARRERRGERAPADDDSLADALPGFVSGARGFDVEVRTDAPEYLVRDDPADTESMLIQVVSSQDGYLSLFTGGLGPDLAILAPNDLLAQFPVRAGEPVLFPLREWYYRGIELKPTLPEGRDESPQVVIAVVTRRPWPLPLVDWSEPQGRRVDDRVSLRLFQLWLSRIPLAERGVAQAFYVVRRD